MFVYELDAELKIVLIHLVRLLRQIVLTQSLCADGETLEGFWQRISVSAILIAVSEICIYGKATHTCRICHAPLFGRLAGVLLSVQPVPFFPAQDVVLMMLILFVAVRPRVLHDDRFSNARHP